MLVMIDNYDSFTYNLVQYFGELGVPPKIFRNDKITIEELESLNPKAIIISPGPGRPEGAGISKDVIKTFGETTPILGVCLGHQSIGEIFGGKTIHAPTLMHGKTSEMYHDGKTIYQGLDDPFIATRYHSLVIDPETLPKCLHKTSWTDDGIIMGVRHDTFPVEGIQFHPESILTTSGKQLLKNFLDTYWS